MKRFLSASLSALVLAASIPAIPAAAVKYECQKQQYFACDGQTYAFSVDFDIDEKLMPKPALSQLYEQGVPTGINVEKIDKAPENAYVYDFADDEAKNSVSEFVYDGKTYTHNLPRNYELNYSDCKAVISYISREAEYNYEAIRKYDFNRNGDLDLYDLVGVSKRWLSVPMNFTIDENGDKPTLSRMRSALEKKDDETFTLTFEDCPPEPEAEDPKETEDVTTSIEIGEETTCEDGADTNHCIETTSEGETYEPMETTGEPGGIIPENAFIIQLNCDSAIMDNGLAYAKSGEKFDVYVEAINMPKVSSMIIQLDTELICTNIQLVSSDIKDIGTFVPNTEKKIALWVHTSDCEITNGNLFCFTFMTPEVFNDNYADIKLTEAQFVNDEYTDLYFDNFFNTGVIIDVDPSAALPETQEPEFTTAEYYGTDEYGTDETYVPRETSTPVTVTEPFAIELGSYWAKPGDTINVVCSVGALKGCAGFSVELMRDVLPFTCTDITILADSMKGIGNFVPNIENPLAVWANYESKDVYGELLCFTIKIDDAAAEGSYQLKFSSAKFIDDDYNDIIPKSISNGKIIISNNEPTISTFETEDSTDETFPIETTYSKPYTLGLSSCVAKAGDTIDVVCSVNNLGNCAGFSIELLRDGSLFTCTGIELISDDISGIGNFVPNVEEGIAVWANHENKDIDGKLVCFTLKIKDNILEGRYPLKFASAKIIDDMYNELIPDEIINGSILIESEEAFMTEEETTAEETTTEEYEGT